jgi:hypothetical protein
MHSRRRKAALRRLCTCERLTLEHHLLRACCLVGNRNRRRKEAHDLPRRIKPSRLLGFERERERVRASAATRRTSSCCSTARSCSYLHPLSQARCYLHPLHFGADGELPPLLQLIDGKVIHPLVDDELVHPLWQHINSKQSELILHFCSSSILHHLLLPPCRSSTLFCTFSAHH